MTNPLLIQSALPLFSQIKPEHVVPAVKQAIEHCREVIEQVVNQEHYTWDNLIQPIDEADDKFSRVWSPVSHLNSVKKTITNALRDFELSGIGLPEAQQKRYGEIVAKLSELSSNYSNNVLDATMGWTKLITNIEELAGLPESALAAAKAQATAKGLEGWLVTLDMPSYIPVMMYCDNRDLRYEMYHAYTTRASDQGPNAHKWDNTENIKQILALRHELAQLLGFDSYAHISLATKMADRPEQVLAFLNDLAEKAKPQGEEELIQLKRYAYEYFGASDIKPWDISYYSEKQKQFLYTINDEELRPYFPEEKVISGLFEVVNRIFGITFKERKDVEVWSPEVRFFDLFDKQGQYKASFYLDLYAREHKRGGAWMDDCIGQMRFADGHLQKPVAYLTCNFNRPVDDKPALFTHNEVTTLFHEFGHGLHHMLTEIETSSVAGINGVAWDAVELPSQFLENWCWQPEALAFISGHYQTGEPLPKEMLTKMLDAKNYQAALFILRQLEFGLFDFRLHFEYSPEQGALILETLKQVRELVAVTPTVEWGRFPHAFSHVFAGGYAAGYYSYLWADAFSRFEEEGIFNVKTGNEFLDHILSQGGSDEPMTLFKNFRGREPKLEALLHHYGIKSSM